MRYRTFFAGLLVVAVASVSCQDEIKKRAAGDPVPAGMGTLAVTATSGAVTGITSFLSDAALASTKPSLKTGSGNVVVGVFPEATSLSCGSGTGTIAGTAPGDLTATFTNCQDGPYTITATVAINVPSVRTCQEDIALGNSDHEVPVSLTATVATGTVTVAGQAVTLTNFGVAITNPTYYGLPDQSTDVGGTCGLLSASVHATGQMSTDTAGETTTIDLGSNSLDIGVEDQGTQVQATINGSLTVNTTCTSDPYSITIVTESPLVIPDGDTVPTSGVLIVNGETVDFLNNPAPPIPCSGFL
jgi:hypothetical protein